MNIERPEYASRTFYGPLELSKEIPRNGSTYITLHPDDPTKLIRSTDLNNFYDHDGMNALVYGTQKVLEGLREHGVNHVNPLFIDQTGESKKPHLITIVDRLQNVESYNELTERGLFADDQLAEIDHVLCGMADFTLQSIYEEGYISVEMMRLNQFVYDKSQPAGKKMVLVDVEPQDACKIDARQDSMEHGSPTQLTSTVAKLVIDTIVNVNRAKSMLTSTEKVARLVEALPGDSAKTIKAKTQMLQALDNRTIDLEVMRLVYEDADNQDDWILN